MSEREKVWICRFRASIGWGASASCAHRDSASRCGWHYLTPENATCDHGFTGSHMFVVPETGFHFSCLGFPPSAPKPEREGNSE